MTGPLLAEAARLADEAHRLLVASLLRLDAAEVAIAPEAEAEIAELLEDAHAYAAELLRVADAFGHAAVVQKLKIKTDPGLEPRQAA